jgi:hypothetical protein
MNLPNFLKRRLIDSVLAKPIKAGGVVRIGAGVELVDMKLMWFEKDEEPWLIVESREGDDLICSTWNGKIHTGETRYPIGQFVDQQFKVKHYVGPSTVYYDSLSDYARGYYVKIPYLKILLARGFERAGTVLYNRRRLVVGQRLDLVTFMIEQAAEGKLAFSPIDLMTDMHSIRWITHPDGESAQGRLSLYLNSLVDTGELSKRDHEYYLTGYALKLVEERSEQERKHKQGIRIQVLIALLTLVTAILAIVQAGVIRLDPLLDLTKRNGGVSQGR